MGLNLGFAKPAAMLWSSAHCQIKLVLKMGFGHTSATQLSSRGRDKPKTDIQIFEFYHKMLTLGFEPSIAGWN